jgi:hypothetical protein
MGVGRGGPCLVKPGSGGVWWSIIQMFNSRHGCGYKIGDRDESESERRVSVSGQNDNKESEVFI